MKNYDLRLTNDDTWDQIGYLLRYKAIYQNEADDQIRNQVKEHIRNKVMDKIYESITAQVIGKIKNEDL